MRERSRRQRGNPVRPRSKSARRGRAAAASRPGRQVAGDDGERRAGAQINPPSGEEPIEWLLLTNLPIDDVEGAAGHSVLLRRWMIEVFFRVLKSGCRVEARRFEAF